VNHVQLYNVNNVMVLEMFVNFVLEDIDYGLLLQLPELNQMQQLNHNANHVKLVAGNVKIIEKCAQCVYLDITYL